MKSWKQIKEGIADWLLYYFFLPLIGEVIKDIKIQTIKNNLLDAAYYESEIEKRKVKKEYNEE